MSITSLKIWKKIQPYVRVGIDMRSGGAGRKHRFRIELAEMPLKLQEEALNVTMPCVECGGTIHPIRARKAPKKRGDEAQGLYYAPTCPLDVNIGCSRGRATRDEYEHIGALFHPKLVKP